MKYIGLIISCCLLPITQAHGAPGKIAAEARRKVELERVRAEADARVAEERRRTEAEVAAEKERTEMAEARVAAERKALKDADAGKFNPATVVRAAERFRRGLRRSDPSSAGGDTGAGVGRSEEVESPAARGPDLGASAGAGDDSPTASSENIAEITSRVAARAKLSRALVEKPDETDADATIEKIHKRFDGSKYSPSSAEAAAPSPTPEKFYNDQAPLETKIDRVMDYLASRLVDLIWDDFFPVIKRTSTDARSTRFTVDTYDDVDILHTKPDFNLMMRRFVNRTTVLRYWRAPDAITTRDRFVTFALGLLVCSIIKPTEADRISSQETLVKQLSKDLWLTDINEIMRIFSFAMTIHKYSDLKQSEVAGTKRDVIDDVLASPEEYEGLIHGINLKRALGTLQNLPNSVLGRRP